MLKVIDRKLIAEPPELPPLLRGPGRPRREFVIMPDILHCEVMTKTQHENCWTIHYVWMCRMEGFFENVEVAHVNSRRYRQWLETYEMKDGIPPHISFGGAVVSGKGDPDFHARWVRYVQKTFC